MEIDARELKIRGDAFHRVGEFVKACGEYTKAIHLDPTYADAYRARAKVLLDLGEDQSAEADFAKAKELEAED